MDINSFKATLDQAAPPPNLTRPVAALWHAARGDWEAAHKLVQADEGEPSHDWVHAYLHRVEGDLSNAGYWYRRAGKPAAKSALETEWAEIASALLA